MSQVKLRAYLQIAPVQRVDAAGEGVYKDLARKIVGSIKGVRHLVVAVKGAPTRTLPCQNVN